MVIMQENLRPPFSVEDAISVLKTYYDIHAESIHELTAELDRNFHIYDGEKNEYILKIGHHSLSHSILDLQNKTLNHIAQSFDFCPQLIPTTQNTDMAQVNGADDKVYSVRLLNYLPGIPLVDFRPHSAKLLSDIGQQLGRLSSVMQSFEHQEKRLEYRWNVLNFLDIVPLAEGMPEEKHEIIEYFASLYEQNVLPNLGSVRRSFIYNDANDHNILVQVKDFADAQVSGFIDFGDMGYSLTVAELAVALAYIMMDKSYPLDAAATVIQAYVDEFPLTEQEIEMLFTLIATRLCMSVCISWYQQRQEPDNQHLSISEAAAWRPSIA